VLDSSGGSVNDSIALGRRFRSLGALTTVGATVRRRPRRANAPACAGSLLRVDVRVPAAVGQDALRAAGAHVRVHQIWMGDRADDARPQATPREDLMIVERDIGRLAKYTFDMGAPAICCRWR
jgi:hypothetical protein